MSRTEGKFRCKSFSVMRFVFSGTHTVTSFVIDRVSRNNILPQWSRGCRGAIGFRSLVGASPDLSALKQFRQFQQIVFARRRVSMLVF